MAKTQITYKGEIAREYISKFPKSSTMAIARIIHNDYPIDFPSVDNARGIVRTHRDERSDRPQKNAVGERTEQQKKRLYENKGI